MSAAGTTSGPSTVHTQGDGDCQQCGRHTDGTLCARCLGKLVAVLGELPALMHELEQVVTRQDHLEAISARVYGIAGDVAAGRSRTQTR